MRESKLGVAAALLLVAVGCRHLPEDAGSSDPGSYSFLVAGHAYGSHGGANIGLHPPFLAALDRDWTSDIAFIVFAGDIVEHSTPAEWEQVERELRPLGVPYYFALGNHDVSPHAQKIFERRFGGTHYSFARATELFLVLDGQRQWGSVTPDQISFVQEALDTHPDARNVFVILHELIWTADRPEYRHIEHNYGSYDDLFDSNFWDELFPVLQAEDRRRIYVVAGDVGGNAGVIPAFYEERGHVVLLATGMGEVEDENYLRVDVTAGKVELRLVPLGEPDTLQPLETYTPGYLAGRG